MERLERAYCGNMIFLVRRGRLESGLRRVKEKEYSLRWNALDVTSRSCELTIIAPSTVTTVNCGFPKI